MYKKFSYGIWISFVISMLIWGVTYQLVPPMVSAVPNCQWAGYAKQLVSMTELVMQYPFLPLLYPCLIVGLCVFVYLNQSVLRKEGILKFLSTLNAFSILLVVGMIAFIIIGTFDMQEQMVANMGLSAQKTLIDVPYTKT